MHDLALCVIAPQLKHANGDFRSLMKHNFTIISNEKYKCKITWSTITFIRVAYGSVGIWIEGSRGDYKKLNKEEESPL